MPSPIRFLLPALSLLPLAPASAAPAAKKPAAKKPAQKPRPAPRSVAPKAGTRKPQPRRPSGGVSGASAGPTLAPVAPQVREAAPAPVADVGPRTFALLVGVGSYASPLISRLSFPAQDATALRDAFVDTNLGAIPKERVLLLTDAKATRSEILGAVDTFFKPQVRAGDRMIVFLAGHGIAKGVGLEARSWFLPHDVQGFTTPKLEASGVEMKALADKLGELPAAQFALFVDACREDPTPGRGVKSNAMSDVMARSIQVAPRERAVDSVTLFACSVGQRAYEDPALSHGVFTYSILQALRDPALPKQQGFVDAAILARYVGENVSKWARNLAQTQDADIEQTPEMVAGALSEGVRVLKLRQGGGAEAQLALPASLGVTTVPERAHVFIDGQEIGLSPLVRNFAAGALPAGEVKLRVEARGSAPMERTVKVLPGYAQQIDFFLLKPGVSARDIAPSPPSRTSAALPPASTSTDAAAPESPLARQAREAEERGDFKGAKDAYQQLVEAEPGNALARERLAQICSRYGDRDDMAAAITYLLPLNTATPAPRPGGMAAVPPRGPQRAAAPDAHSLAVLSRAYSSLALRLAASEAPPAPKLVRPKFAAQRWLRPEPTWTSWQYALQAFLAAEDALKLDPQSAEALVARGLALIAGDTSAPGNNARDRESALANFTRAADIDRTNADAHYALGLGLRAFGANLEDTPRKAQMLKARESLSKAIALRPDFYEARREMALCAALMGDRATALSECEVAISYRGSANDADEVAALELAMSVWHKRAAAAETDPKKKADHEQAGAGYEADAQDTADDKNLSRALKIISFVGINKGNFLSLLPRGVAQLWNVAENPEAAIKSRANEEINKATGKIKLPGGNRIRIPGF